MRRDRLAERIGHLLDRVVRREADRIARIERRLRELDEAAQRRRLADLPEALGRRGERRALAEEVALEARAASARAQVSVSIVVGRALAEAALAPRADLRAWAARRRRRAACSSCSRRPGSAPSKKRTSISSPIDAGRPIAHPALRRRRSRSGARRSSWLLDEHGRVLDRRSARGSRSRARRCR